MNFESTTEIRGRMNGAKISGYSETSVASATLLVGVTLTGDGTAVAGAADGSFEVIVIHQ